METQTLLGVPLTRIRTFCKLAFQERRDEFKAWERLLPKRVLRPVIISFAMGQNLLVRHKISFDEHLNMLTSMLRESKQK